MIGRKMGVVAISDNHWPSVGEYRAAIVDAVETVQPGEVKPVFCGTFLPRRFKKPVDPAI